VAGGFIGIHNRGQNVSNLLVAYARDCGCCVADYCGFARRGNLVGSFRRGPADVCGVSPRYTVWSHYEYFTASGAEPERSTFVSAVDGVGRAGPFGCCPVIKFWAACS
jgi:hypothetical protein